MITTQPGRDNLQSAASTSSKTNNSPDTSTATGPDFSRGALNEFNFSMDVGTHAGSVDHAGRATQLVELLQSAGPCQIVRLGYGDGLSATTSPFCGVDVKQSKMPMAVSSSPGAPVSYAGDNMWEAPTSLTALVDSRRECGYESVGLRAHVEMKEISEQISRRIFREVDAELRARGVPVVGEDGHPLNTDEHRAMRAEKRKGEMAVLVLKNEDDPSRSVLMFDYPSKEKGQGRYQVAIEMSAENAERFNSVLRQDPSNFNAVVRLFGGDLPPAFEITKITSHISQFREYVAPPPQVEVPQSRWSRFWGAVGSLFTSA